MSAEQKFQEIIASFQGLNWNNVGNWPLVVKASIYLAAAMLVLVAAYAVFITPHNKAYEVEHKKEQNLIDDFEEKSFKAMNLDAYKKQLADMEEAFGALLRQLPKDTEVPSLLEDITHTGLGSGLEFSMIDLGQETKHEFYAELPIQIRVSGDYHGFGSFVSGVASLPRIVTLHDFAIQAAPQKNVAKGKVDKKSSGPRLLEMVITAKTYRYNETTEEDAAAAAKDDKKSKGKSGKKKASDNKGE